MFLQTDSECSDQTGRMPRLILVFAGRTCHFVGFVMLQLKSLLLSLQLYKSKMFLFCFHIAHNNKMGLTAIASCILNN